MTLVTPLRKDAESTDPDTAQVVFSHSRCPRVFGAEAFSSDGAPICRLPDSSGSRRRLTSRVSWIAKIGIPYPHMTLVTPRRKGGVAGLSDPRVD